jgi:alkylation response protein AidB-like acyl-CoA dehydrogenase
VNMATYVQTARLILYEAARSFDQSVATRTSLAFIVKLNAVRTTEEVPDVAIQLHGDVVMC